MSAGQVVGGIIGVMLAPFTGGMSLMMAWTIGSTIGGMLFPPKGPDGPRLSDLKVQSSEYGRPIPKVYGTVGIAGNVIWASDLIEVEGDSGGGKGGSEQTTFSYLANFAVAVCEGGDDIGFGRIWAGPDKRLIFDGTLLEGDGEIRFYSGTEDQLPDPLIESYEGVGNVPAYRGTAYVVFENFPVQKDGNRIPFLTIEVGRASSEGEEDENVGPEALGVVYIQQVIVTDEHYIVLYNGSYYGIIIRELSTGMLVKHFAYDIDEWNFSSTAFYDADRNVLVRPEIGTLLYDTVDLEDGSITEHTITATTPGTDPGVIGKGGVYHNGEYVFAANGSGSLNTAMYVMDPDTHTAVATYTYDMNGDFAGPVLAPIDGENWLYGYSTGAVLKRYPLSIAAPSVTLGTPAAVTTILQMKVDPYTGLIWSVTLTGATLAVHAYNNDTAVNFTYSSSAGGLAGLALDPITFLPGRVIINGAFGLATDIFVEFDADSPSLIQYTPGGYFGAAALDSMAYNPVTDRLMAFREGGWITFSNDATNDPASVNFLQTGTYVPEVDNKYLGEADWSSSSSGSTLRAGQPLSEVVLALCLAAGLTEEQVDVTELEDDIVDGYAIGSQTTIRDAIAPLQSAYFFDAVESEGVVKFIKRGGAIAVVIPDADVGAFEAGSEAPDPLETVRRMENELPRRVNVNYIQEATNYSPATKKAQRLIGASGEEMTLDMPIVMSDTKGQEVAEVNLHGAWVERISYRFSLPRKYSYLEPTDVIVVFGYTMRIEKLTANDGVLKCEAKHDDSNVYSPNVVVTETPPDDQTVETVSDVLWELA